MMESEDTLKIVLKGKMKYLQKGQVEHILTMANEIKTFPIYFLP